MTKTRIPESLVPIVKRYDGALLPEHHSAISTLMPMIGKIYETANGLAVLNIDTHDGPHNEVLYRFYPVYLE